ncbi:lysophospholipid acyltransferase family protein [Methylobacter sp. YRD-M1]|uniref:lysophospholipid acyltransferase family protein n=1 Tax=Methylobacter sp. YRD-M1 TaxID=2911520 RepID=UPI00227C19F3|nr:lysophospholipid acyltransferase family protein [Methylobacter sp. YRD-M1]WAK02818.1 1-acyl-sn-glycerol-3-phosphate acyltransferase [Methylobacter sp. YRD-M1]
MTQHSTSFQGNKLRLYLGSALLFISIFTTATIDGILILLCMPAPFAVRYKIATAWCSLVVWMTKFFCGLGYEVEGLEHIKGLDAAIVLSKHQSAWETLALRHILPPQTTLLKRSLLWMPLWGWALATLRPIAIDRENQRAAMRKLLDQGTACLQEGLWVVTFPEGTRTAPGEEKKFGAGGAMLAQKSGYPVIPVALNAGEYWPRYSFLKYPGTIKVKIGPPIESRGRKAADINAEAEAWIRQAMQDISTR